VDELVRQRDSITGHLDQLRNLLGSMPVPGLDRLAEAAKIHQHDEEGAEEVETAGAIADGDGQHTIVLPDAEQEPAGTKG